MKARHQLDHEKLDVYYSPSNDVREEISRYMIENEDENELFLIRDELPELWG